MFKRTLGTYALLLAAVGGIVGSGWLFGPYFAAKIAGPAAVLAWIIGGGLMMVIALTFAELSSTFPMAGGTMHYIKLSHGPVVSFAMVWLAWLSSAAVAPVETLALVHYAENYLPWLMQDINGMHVLTGKGVMVASAVMLIMCLVNSIGVRVLSKANNIIVLLKLLVPVATIIMLLCVDHHTSNFVSHQFMPFGWHGVLAALPTAGIIFSFIGYSPAIQLAGEAKNPQRSVPIAIFGAIAICILLYTFLQIAFVGALVPKDFTGGWQHLNFSGDAGPFAGLVVGLGMAWFAKIIFLDAAISPFGTGLIYTATSSRMAYAMGSQGYLPKWFLKNSKLGVPVRIIALNFMLGLFLFLPFPTWQNMMSFLVSSLVFAYAVGPLSLIVLRKTMPNYKRPFRVPAAKWVCLLAFYICNLVIFWTGWQIVGKMLMAISVGYVLLLTYGIYTKKIQIAQEWVSGLWFIFYLVSIGVTSYFSTFGGNGALSFGWDFLVIAAQSVIFFNLSQYYAFSDVEKNEAFLAKHV